MKLLLLLSLLAAFPGVCLAQSFSGRGEWCLILDEIEQCSFNTPDDCYASAYINGGYCRQNERKSRVAGNTPWCVVSAAGRDCTYYTQQICINAALKIEGGCVPNTEKALANTQERNKYLGFFDPTKEEDDGSDQSLAERLQEAQNAQEALMSGEQPQ
jgi:hypothetical protein